MSAPLITIYTANSPQVMRLHGELAEEIGLNESIVLLQLEFLIRSYKNERDGRLWAYKSLEELRQEYFKWWSPATISRIIKKLEELELITVANFNATSYDRTQWFALNEVGLARLTSIKIEVTILQNEKSISSDCKIDSSNLQNRSDQNETTIPKSLLNHQRISTTTRQPKIPTKPATPRGAGAPGGGGPLLTEKPTETEIYLRSIGCKNDKAIARHKDKPVEGVKAEYEILIAKKKNCHDPGALLISILDSPDWVAPSPSSAAPLPERPQYPCFLPEWQTWDIGKQQEEMQKYQIADRKWKATQGGRV